MCVCARTTVETDRFAQMSGHCSRVRVHVIYLYHLRNSEHNWLGVIRIDTNSFSRKRYMHVIQNEQKRKRKSPSLKNLATLVMTFKSHLIEYFTFDASDEYTLGVSEKISPHLFIVWLKVEPAHRDQSSPSISLSVLTVLKECKVSLTTQKNRQHTK